MKTGFFKSSEGETILKDPQAKLDYTLNWSAWLGTDTIITSTWSAEAGITVDSNSNTTTKANVWLSGGTKGTTYTVTNHIVTAAGREEDRSFFVKCEER